DCRFLPGLSLPATVRTARATCLARAAQYSAHRLACQPEPALAPPRRRLAPGRACSRRPRLLPRRRSLAVARRRRARRTWGEPPAAAGLLLRIHTFSIGHV